MLQRYWGGSIASIVSILPCRSLSSFFDSPRSLLFWQLHPLGPWSSATCLKPNRQPTPVSAYGSSRLRLVNGARQSRHQQWPRRTSLAPLLASQSSSPPAWLVPFLYLVHDDDVTLSARADVDTQTSYRVQTLDQCKTVSISRLTMTLMLHRTGSAQDSFRQTYARWWWLWNPEEPGQVRPNCCRHSASNGLPRTSASLASQSTVRYIEYVDSPSILSVLVLGASYVQV